MDFPFFFGEEHAKFALIVTLWEEHGLRCEALVYCDTKHPFAHLGSQGPPLTGDGMMGIEQPVRVALGLPE